MSGQPPSYDASAVIRQLTDNCTHQHQPIHVGSLPEVVREVAAVLPGTAHVQRRPVDAEPEEGQDVPVVEAAPGVGFVAEALGG